MIVIANCDNISKQKGHDDMIKVAFCDDDMSVLDEIERLLDQYCEKQNREIRYASFQNSLELLAEIEKGMCFDVLFLDVIMPGMDGIHVAKEQ